MANYYQSDEVPDPEKTMWTEIGDFKSALRERCEDAIIEMVGSSLSGMWWYSKNKAFDNLTPNEQWEKDHMSVFRYVMKFVDGEKW